MVDTGCGFSLITPEQLRILGFDESDLMEPIGDELGYLKLDVTINAYEMSKGFRVKDANFNLLGLDVLAMFCCIIDLDKGYLTLREYHPEILAEMPRTTVSIEGKDVEVEIDTGSSLYLSGRMSLAEELGLALKPLEQLMIGVDYEATIRWMATDVSLKAFGRETRNAEFVVLPEEIQDGYKDPTMGVEFLYGLRL